MPSAQRWPFKFVFLFFSCCYFCYKFSLEQPSPLIRFGIQNWFCTFLEVCMRLEDQMMQPTCNEWHFRGGNFWSVLRYGYSRFCTKMPFICVYVCDEKVLLWVSKAVYCRSNIPPQNKMVFLPVTLYLSLYFVTLSHTISHCYLTWMLP